jgi:hypothetical protein
VMAVFRKFDLKKHQDEFDQRSAKLRELIAGSQPHRNVYDQFSQSPDDFIRDFVDIDLAKLDYALDDFKTSLKQISNLKRLMAHRLASRK